MTSYITWHSNVCPTVCSGYQQRKYKYPCYWPFSGESCWALLQKGKLSGNSFVCHNFIMVKGPVSSVFISISTDRGICMLCTWRPNSSDMSYQPVGWVLRWVSLGTISVGTWVSMFSILGYIWSNHNHGFQWGFITHLCPKLSWS